MPERNTYYYSIILSSNDQHEWSTIFVWGAREWKTLYLYSNWVLIWLIWFVAWWDCMTRHVVTALTLISSYIFQRKIIWLFDEHFQDVVTDLSFQYIPGKDLWWLCIYKHYLCMFGTVVKRESTSYYTIMSVWLCERLTIPSHEWIVLCLHPK